MWTKILLVSALAAMSGAAQGQTLTEISKRLPVSNPGRNWHGDGLRLSLQGVRPVAKGCASSISAKVRFESVRADYLNSGVSAYTYISGRFDKAGFESGIADGRTFVVQNGGRWKGSYGGGGFDPFKPLDLKVSITRNGDTKSQVTDASGFVADATTEDDPDFVRGDAHKYTHVVMAIAYRNNDDPTLDAGDTYLGWIDSKGTQTIECPSAAPVSVPLTFVPHNRMSEIPGATQIYEIKREGATEYAVLIGASEEKRAALMEQLKLELGL